MKALYVIPARGGSKGLPGKNIKALNGKPLIRYAIDVALALTTPDHICVSTDDEAIKKVAEQSGLSVPFIRPAELASDTASMDDVLRHAVEFNTIHKKQYEAIVLLQPTSPLRTSQHVKSALALYSPEIEMVMSVYETKANPYYVLFEEQSEYLIKSKEGNFDTRQSAPKVYQANGAVYIINIAALQQKPMKRFTRIKKFVMDEQSSVDIDTAFDFDYCEFLISRANLKS